MSRFADPLDMRPASAQGAVIATLLIAARACMARRTRLFGNIGCSQREFARLGADLEWMALALWTHQATLEMCQESCAEGAARVNSALGEADQLAFGERAGPKAFRIRKALRSEAEIFAHLRQEIAAALGPLRLELRRRPAALSAKGTSSLHVTRAGTFLLSGRYAGRMLHELGKTELTRILWIEADSESAAVLSQYLSHEISQGLTFSRPRSILVRRKFGTEAA